LASGGAREKAKAPVIYKHIDDHHNVPYTAEKETQVAQAEARGLLARNGKRYMYIRK
jgi:hypothetical protein